MKRKRLALLLAAAMTVTSLDSTAMFVSGADFSSEVEEEVATQAEEGEDVADEVSADDTSADVEFSDETIDAEVPDESEVEAEVTDEEASQDADVQVEEDTDEPDFSADVQEDVAVDAGDSVFPENMQKLELNKDYDVYINESDQSVWFSFTPAESGNYMFMSTSGDDIRPITYIYNENASSIWDNMDFSDSGKGDSDFLLNFELEKGKTYYYRVQLSGDEYLTSFKVRLERTPEADKVSFDLSEAKTKFNAGLDCYNIEGVKVLVNYKDGRTPSILTFDRDTVISDQLGNIFAYTLVRKTEDNDEVYPLDEALEAGKYEVIFTWNNNVIQKLSITAGKADISSFQALNIGENTVKMDWKCAMHWYSFDIKEDGYYDIDDTELDDDYEGGIVRCWKAVDQNGEFVDYDSSKDEENMGCWLTKGSKYLLGWYDNSKEAYQGIVTVTKIPMIKSVKVMDSPKTEFLEYTDSVDFNNLKIEITYEDGNKETLWIGGQDSYGRVLSGKLVDQNDMETEDAYPKAGNYKYKICIAGVYADDIPVKVMSLEESVNEQLKDGETDVINNGRVILKYKASRSGRYAFNFNVMTSEIGICKADGFVPDNVSEEDYGTRMYADLEKDAIYYVTAEPDAFCKDIKVNVTFVTKPVGITIRSLKKTPYIAGVEYFNDTDIETTIDLGEGRTRTFRGTSASVEGYYLGYKMVNKDTGEETDESIGRLDKGTWEVTPYLKASQDGEEVELSVAPKSITITSKVYDESELNNMPVLKENTWNSLENTRGNMKAYTFTPQESGIYKYSYENEGNEYTVSFYENGRRAYAELWDIYSGARLEAGKKYLVVVYTYKNEKLKISHITSGEKPEAVKTLALTAGMKKTVTIGEGAAYIKCTYTPEQDGYYTLQSCEYEGIYTDPYVYLKEGNTIIASANDSEESDQFKLTTKLMAGKTYVYEVRIQDVNDEEYSELPIILEFNKKEVSEVKNAELVLKDGKKASDYNIVGDINEVYQMKITYVNGKTWITNITDSYPHMQEDPYGNTLHMYLTRNGASAGNEMMVHIVLRCGPMYEGKLKDLSFDIKCGAVGALKEIETDKDYQLPNDTTQYKFIAKETGEYIYSLISKANESGTVRMFTAGDTPSMGVVDVHHEGDYIYSVHLEKGKTYWISAVGNRGVNAGTFRLQKVIRTLNGLTIKKVPDKQTLLPDNGDTVSCGGLQVEASYTDGTSEVLSYGQRDSSGRKLYISEIIWMSSGNAKVYMALGRYTAAFELKPASLKDVQEIKLGENKKLDASKDDFVTLKFVPKEDGEHYINIAGGDIYSILCKEDIDEIKGYRNSCDLEAGKAYYINIRAVQDAPSIVITTACRDDKHSFGAWKTVKAATCVATGLRSHTCTNCGKEETEVIPATGKHSMSSWKVTVASTVTVMGTKERKCTVCGKKETARIAKLKPTITLSVGVNKTIPLKVKQSLPVKAYGFAKGDRVVSWTTSSAKIATVSKTGTVVGKAAGTATITVKLLSGLKASFKVKVQKTEVATTALKVVNKATGKTLKSATLKLKKSLTLVTTVTPSTSKQKVTYTSSNKKVATVSAKGVITAKKAGTTTITVKSGKKSVKITIKVTK